jgi:hypothetical protein
MKARLHNSPVMTISRAILKHQKVVYLLVSRKPIQYDNGRSKIAYIGQRGGAFTELQRASHSERQTPFQVED